MKLRHVIIISLVLCLWLAVMWSINLSINKLLDATEWNRKTLQWHLTLAYMEGIVAQKIPGPPWVVEKGKPFILTLECKTNENATATITSIYPGYRIEENANENYADFDY